MTFLTPSTRFTPDEARVYRRRLLDRSRELPGVEAVGAISNLHPLNTSSSDFNVDGLEPTGGGGTDHGPVLRRQSMVTFTRPRRHSVSASTASQGIPTPCPSTATPPIRPTITYDSLRSSAARPPYSTPILNQISQDFHGTPRKGRVSPIRISAPVPARRSPSGATDECLRAETVRFEFRGHASVAGEAAVPPGRRRRPGKQDSRSDYAGR